MSNAYLSPILQDAQFNDDGTFLAGGLIWFYQAGTTTPVLAYTTPDADTAWPNPIQLNARGETGGEIWLLNGTTYKMVLESPPEYGQAHGVVISTFDNISGVNEPGDIANQNWVTFSGTPIYLTPATFSVSGDYQAIFLTGRRLKMTNGAGGITYGTVVDSIYSLGSTTITVSPDYGQTVDSGIASVQYGFIETGDVSSIPVPVFAGSANSGSGSTLWIDYDPAIGLRWAQNAGALTLNWPINAATATAAATNSFATQQTSSQGIISVKRIGVNDVSLVNDSTSWGLLEQNVGYAVQYNRSTSKYSYGGFTLPSPATSKYIQLPNGLIMQFGQGTASNAGTSVTFPTAFGSFAVSVVGTQVGSTHVAISANSLTTTGFTAYCATTEPFSYIAFGY